MSRLIAWETATLEERSELAHLLFKEVGCDLQRSLVTWVKPNPDYELLFRLTKSDWEVTEEGRYLYRHSL